MAEADPAAQPLLAAEHALHQSPARSLGQLAAPSHTTVHHGAECTTVTTHSDQFTTTTTILVPGGRGARSRASTSPLPSTVTSPGLHPYSSPARAASPGWAPPPLATEPGSQPPPPSVRSPSSTIPATEFGRPGHYVVVVGDGIMVTPTLLGDSPYMSATASQLPKGTVVEVLEVDRCESVQRLRGRIAQPPGWISLMDLASGYRAVAITPAPPPLPAGAAGGPGSAGSPSLPAPAFPPAIQAGPPPAAAAAAAAPVPSLHAQCSARGSAPPAPPPAADNHFPPPPEGAEPAYPSIKSTTQSTGSSVRPAAPPQSFVSHTPEPAAVKRQLSQKQLERVGSKEKAVEQMPVKQEGGLDRSVVFGLVAWLLLIAVPIVLWATIDNDPETSVTAPAEDPQNATRQTEQEERCSAPGPDICDPGGSGVFLGGDLGGIPDAAQAVIWCVLLLWSFVGVAIVADVFMSAIEAVTSSTNDVMREVKGPDGKVRQRRFRVKVWNATVANLTLMALGSSAPEILLSVIELLSNNWCSGALGPSTIVGSAAFNLLVISGVVIQAIPADETRLIADLKVYMVTATWSVLAYVYLVVVLLVASKDLIEVWEAVLCFLFMPVLVWIAFTADRYKDPVYRSRHPCLRFFSGPPDASFESAPKYLLDVKNADGSNLTAAQLQQLLKQLKSSNPDGLSDKEMQYKVDELMRGQQPRTRAYWRVKATRMMTGSARVKEQLLDDPAQLLQNQAPPTLGFASQNFSCLEADGFAVVKVVREGRADFPVSVDYMTQDGSKLAPDGTIGATAGQDYKPTMGTVNFTKGQRLADIKVPVLDNPQQEQDKWFTIALHDARGPAGRAAAGGAPANMTTVTRSSAKVRIIDDDQAGVFTFPEETVKVLESDKVAIVRVERIDGSSGKVGLSYRTMPATATENFDYIPKTGTLEWGDSDTAPRCIKVDIIQSDTYEQDEYFEIEITDATGGAKFDDSTDGAADRCVARVYIQSSGTKSVLQKLTGCCGVNEDRCKLGFSQWARQFTTALSVSGDDDDDGGDGEKPKGPSAFDYISHMIALPWKLIFASIAPTIFCGGKLCFVWAISYIGVLTAFIGDFAGLFGCVIGLKPSVVAITFVALGTSLPDTFASKSAAIGDSSADAAIGNITGSNAVNVFLGLGVAWMFGSIYWAVKGDRGLNVQAGDLAFSVIVFCCCALACIGILAARRVAFGAELGGRWRLASAGICFLLWVTYVLLASLKDYGYI